MKEILFCTGLLALVLLAIPTKSQFNEITFSYKLGNRSFSYVGTFLTAYPEIKVDTPYSVVTTVNGTYANESYYENIEGFYVQSRIIKYFPINIDKFFTNLRAIEISYSQLQFISKNDLKPFEKLISLNLRSNNLIFIEDDVFDNNPLILNLELSGNPFLYISPEAFKNFITLTNFGIDGNLCSKLRTANNYQDVRNLLDQLRMSDCANSSNPHLSYTIQRYSKFNGKNSSKIENCSETLAQKDEEIQVLKTELQFCYQNCSNSNQNSSALENQLQSCLRNASQLQQNVTFYNRTANGYLKELNYCSANASALSDQNQELSAIVEDLKWELSIFVEALDSANLTLKNLTEKLDDCERSLVDLIGWNSTTLNDTIEDDTTTAWTTTPYYPSPTTPSFSNSTTEGNQPENPESGSEESNESSISSRSSSEESDEDSKAGKHKIEVEKFFEILLKIKSKYVKKYENK